MSLAVVAVLERITAPAPVLTKEEVKSRLFIDHNDDDAKIDGNIKSAIGYMDGPKGVLQRCVGEQTWDQSFERFPSGRNVLQLALSPLISLTSIKYYDVDGVQQTLASDKYEVGSDGDLPIINCFDGWPSIDSRRMFPITVRSVVGHTEIPEEFKDALTLHVAALYESRGVTPLALEQLGYFDLIAGHRRPSL